jgi:nicotinate-nucleotide adenylyltransferase
MKFGFYGGTFDPIHNGHLILARDAVEKLGLDRLFFIPNHISPHKLATRPASPEIRAEMLRAAIQDEPRFDLDECEITRPSPSYTVDTMLLMRERFGPKAQFYYFLGLDNVATLSSWRHIEELQKLATFVVLNRSEAVADLPYLTLNRRIDISSTEIRNRIAKGLSIRYMVPDPVYQIITRHALYR